MRSRIFIALKLNEKILNDIVDLRKSVYQDDGITRWESRDKLHLTLKFLGDVDVELISDIDDKLKKLTKRFAKIKVQFSKFGIIKSKSVPKILWLGIKKSAKLDKLFFDINNEFADIGFAIERRKFKPHITLLRIRGSEDFPKIFQFKDMDINLGSALISEIAIYESKLSPTGSVYKKLKSYNLN